MIFHSSYGLHHCCLDGFTLFMDGHSKMSYFFLIPLTQIGSDRGWILNLWFWVTQVIQFLLIQQIESSLWLWYGIEFEAVGQQHQQISKTWPNESNSSLLAGMASDSELLQYSLQMKCRSAINELLECCQKTNGCMFSLIE